MKILILQDDFPPKSFGGAGIAAFNLAEMIQRKGHEVMVVAATQEKSDEGMEEYGGLKIHKIYSNYPLRWRAYLSLYNPQVLARIGRIIYDFKPDVVHAHNIHTHISYHSLRMAKKMGARVILTAHDAMLYHYGKLGISETGKVSMLGQIKKYRFRYNPLRNIIIRFYLKYTDEVFAVSYALAQALESNGIKNVGVIHNGLDPEGWNWESYKRDEFIKKHNLYNKKLVLFGGRLSQPKGGHQIIRAMQKIVAVVPDAFLIVMGKRDEYMEQMLDLAEKTKIRDHVLTTGWISGQDLKSAYASAHVVAMPSVYFEPFGLICLEAMASKKPVVATCFGGTPEIVKDGETGYIVNPLHIEELADKIVELLMDQDKANSFGQAGRELLDKKFNLVHKAEEYLTSYKIKA